MKRAITKSQFILLFSYVIFIAHTLAEPPEAVKHEFMAWRQRQREARLSGRTNRNLQTSTGFEKPHHSLNTDPVPSNNWAGAVSKPPPSETINSVTADWVVTTGTVPPGATGSAIYGFATWVGIDGEQSDCKNSLVQAGLYFSMSTDENGAVQESRISPWYEWFPAFPVYLEDYPVAEGDPINVRVTTTSASTAVATFSNSATKVTKSYPFSAPNSPADNSCGSTAEWILENNLNPGELANFGSTRFQNCGATTAQGSTVYLDGATLYMITEGTDKILAMPTVVSSTELLVTYTHRFIA